MGRRGLKSVSHLAWASVVDRLLTKVFANDCGMKVSQNSERNGLRVAVLDMQPIDPPVGGGRLRLLGLYHGLGESINVRYVGSYDWQGEPFRRHHLTSSLEEIDVPLSDAHHAEASRLALEAKGKVVIDIAFPRLAHLSPEYLAEAMSAVEWADVIVFSHPWVFPLVQKGLKAAQLVIYDAQNVEGLLRAQLLDEQNPVELDLLRDVVRMEYALGTRADLVLTCSHEDRYLFARVYEWPASKIRIVPNGVMASTITPPNSESRASAKKQLKLPLDRKAAIFIGSNYGPNIEAAKFINRELAPKLPMVRFVIAGGVGESFTSPQHTNTVVTGRISDAEKLTWLQASDFAVNPMFAGSGTNIKMFDFMAAGLPIVTTPIGARGIATASTAATRVVLPEDFVHEILKLIASPTFLQLGLRNREWVVSDFAWEEISPRLGNLIRNHVHERTQHRIRNPIASRPGRDAALRLAHLSTVGHKCGIGEYTAKLVRHLSALGVSNYVVTCETPTDVPDLALHGLDGEVGWFYDNIAWRDSRLNSTLVNCLLDWNASTLLVQYHPAFFPGILLESLVDDITAAGIRIAIIVHSFATCDLDSMKRLSRNGVLLFAHSRGEVSDAAAKEVSLVFLPLAVDRPLARNKKMPTTRNWTTQPPIIATTGFIRQHKGLPELIRAIGLLRDEFPQIELRAQCALYPSEDSRQELNNCLAAIEETGLGTTVFLDTGFYPLNELHERLAGADLAVLPYGSSSEGGSAAAATCLGVGLPLVVSGALIFDELRDTAFTLESNSPTSIAQALSRILRSQELYGQLIHQANTYAESHSWEAVSKQLAGALA